MRFSLVVLCAAVVLAVAIPVAGAQQAAPPAQATRPAAPVADRALVNLNSATVAELDTLPGVGPKVAARIVEYRQKNGGFKKPEDLMNVKGIGEKQFLKLKGLVTTAPARAGDRPTEKGAA